MRKFLVPLLAVIAFAGLIPVAETQIPKIPDPPPVLAPRGRGYIPPTPERSRAHYAGAAARHGERLAIQAKFQTLPASFDCREKGWVPPVGDQGQCGSCYLYSTIYGTLSSAFIRAGYGKADGSFLMSVQYGMDCHNFGGCNGGNGTEVIDWVIKNGWPAETWTDVRGNIFKDYPTYSARSQACRKVPTAKYWKPMDWGFATGDQSNRPATTDEIKTALYNYGPLNVALDAGGQFGSGTSTITSLGNNIDHEIELTGWDDADKTFMLKNQWSKDWGNNGYRKLAYNAASKLEVIFWVTAGSLPPPPPPPDIPVIVSATTASGMPNVPFSYTITATNAPHFFEAKGLPLGLALDFGGVIMGTPQVVGVSQVALSARNAAGTGTATLTLTVTDVPVPPQPGGSTIVLPQNTPAGTYTLVRPEDLDEIRRRLDAIRGGK